VRLELPGRQKPYVMAHRGNSVACPENTLAAFRRAFDEGADILETDLHVTSDGVFVCVHDHTADRTCGVPGNFEEMTLAEVKALSASYGRSEFASERIPTLQETFAVIPQGCILALELKSDKFLDAAVAKKLVDEITAAGMRGRTVVLSFNLPRVQSVKRQGPEIPTGFITMQRLIPKPGAELLGPFWPILMVNPFYVAAAHRHSQLVCPLDPTPDSRLWYYRLLGCDAVMTNDPGTTRRVLEKR
jgi:glycerophosphoryl diester phosphodiesterase